MKKVVCILILLAILLSFSACSTPHIETASSQAATPAVSEAEPPSPTTEPTPSPTSTEEPLTFEEEMCLTWLESNDLTIGTGDIYANAVATAAYNDGKFEGLIKEKKLNELQISNMLTANESYAFTYNVSYDNIVNETDGLKLSEDEIAIKAVCGYPMNITADQAYAIYYSISNILGNGDSIISAFPAGSREKINHIIDLYMNITDPKAMEEFVRIVNSDYTDPLSNYYATSYIGLFEGALGGNFSNPTVTYNGSTMTFIEYDIRANMWSYSQDRAIAYLIDKYFVANMDETVKSKLIGHVQAIYTWAQNPTDTNREAMEQLYLSKNLTDEESVYLFSVLYTVPKDFDTVMYKDKEFLVQDYLKYLDEKDLDSLPDLDALTEQKVKDFLSWD